MVVGADGDEQEGQEWFVVGLVVLELQCVNSAGTILLFLSFKQDYLHAIIGA